MRTFRWFLFAALGGVFALTFFWLTPSSGRPGPTGEKKEKGEKPPRGEKPPPDENARLRKELEKALKGRETERDRLLKELNKHYPPLPGMPTPAPGSAVEFEDWFSRLTGGARVWRYDGIAHKSVRELFERMAERLDLASDQITHDEFVRYAQTSLTVQSSPPWKPEKDAGAPPRAKTAARVPTPESPPVAEEAGLPEWFTRLDTDHDGQVSLREWKRAGWSLDEFDRLDLNGDGLLTAHELQRYLQHEAHKHEKPATDLVYRLDRDEEDLRGQPPGDPSAVEDFPPANTSYPGKGKPSKGWPASGKSKPPKGSPKR